MAGRGFGLVVGLAAVLAAAPAAAVVTFEVVPSATVVAPGDPVDIAVVVSGLSNLAAPSLGAFDLKLTFNPAGFAQGAVTFGAGLGDIGALEATTIVTPAAGEVRVYELSLLASAVLVAQQPGTFTLFIARYTATGAGVNGFTLALNAPPADELGAPLTPVVLVPAQVTIGEDIPTLSEWGLLLLIAVLAIVGLRFLRGGAA